MRNIDSLLPRAEPRKVVEGTVNNSFFHYPRQGPPALHARSNDRGPLRRAAHHRGTRHAIAAAAGRQSPIGRNSRSNPATYIGFYDTIRALFTQVPLAIEREYKPGRFSFNVNGGRCEECQGEATITTQLYFMPDSR